MPKDNVNSPSTQESKQPHFLVRAVRALIRSPRLLQAPVLHAASPEEEKETQEEKETVSSTWSILMRSMVGGSLSAALEVGVNHPLWVLKTRYQVGLPFVLDRKILYTGMVTNLFSQIPITVIQVSMNGAVKQWVFKDEDPSHLQRMGIAFFAGAFSAFASTPAETGMTYMEATEKGFIASSKMLVTKRGISALYAGLFETMLRDGGFSAAYLAGQPIVKEWIISLVTKEENSKTSLPQKILISTASGVSVGILAAVATQTADTVKTVRQKAAQTHHIPIKDVLKELGKEGVKGYLRGGFWRCLRIGSAVTLMGEVGERVENYFTRPIT